MCFLAAFTPIEPGAPSPVFDLKLFRNRAFTVSSIVAVIGVPAFLGACFSMSMWGWARSSTRYPPRVGLLFLLLQGPAFVLIPIVSRLLDRVAASLVSASGSP